jgi:putative hydrolase of the HAD superfamily
MRRFDLIAFDADDTLWHNERLFIDAQFKLKLLLSQYHSPEWVEERLFATEMRNLQHYGYGIKAFALSMIETAVELTEGRITGHEVLKIIESAREMLSAEVELLPHTAATVASLAQEYQLMVITKGDLRDQEAKIERSGLAQYFQHIEIVSDKRTETYAKIVQRQGVAPQRFMMIGNALRSDILPVLALGGTAVYVPYELTWVHETHVEIQNDNPNYHQIEHLGLLPNLLAQLNHDNNNL